MLFERVPIKVLMQVLFVAMILYFIASFRVINLETYLAAFGTMMLAYYTAESAEENRRYSARMLAEAENERSRLRVQEQLERVYSPLLGYRGYIAATERWDLLVFDTFTQPFPESYKLTLNQVRSCYEYLALQETRLLLRNFYGYFELGLDMPKDFRDSFLSALQGQHDMLVKRYSEMDG